jgi:hypothetical protein
MKKGPVSKDSAFATNDPFMVCGVILVRKPRPNIGESVAGIRTTYHGAHAKRVHANFLHPHMLFATLLHLEIFHL